MSSAKKVRSPSKSDRDPKVIEIKALRDSIQDKEAANEACKGMYKCAKLADKACLESIIKKLTALKAKEAKEKPAPQKSGGRSRSRSRKRSKSRSKK